MILELLDSAVEERIKFSSYEIYHAAEQKLLQSKLEDNSSYYSFVKNLQNVKKILEKCPNSSEKLEILKNKLPLSDFELMNEVCEFHHHIYESIRFSKKLENITIYLTMHEVHDDHHLLYEHQQSLNKLNGETDYFPRQNYCHSKCLLNDTQIETILENYFDKFYKEENDSRFTRHGD